MLRRLFPHEALAVALIVLSIAGVACGGSDSSSPAATPGSGSQAISLTPTPVATRTPTPARPPATPTNQQILTYAKQFVRTEWNFLASSALPKDLYDMFLPECQKLVTVESLARTPAAVQASYPGLKGLFLQDITFQDTLGVKFVEGNQLQIIVPKLSLSTVTINGKQQNMFEWLKGISTAPVRDEARSFRIVQVGTTLKMASCETLSQWSKP